MLGLPNLYRYDKNIGVIQLSEFHRINLGVTKCFLLKCTDGYLLIDTAYSRRYSAFKRKLNVLGISLNEIKYLLLTHHHDDHTGFAAQLLKEITPEIIIHKEEIQGVKNGYHDEGLEAVNTCIKVFLTIFNPHRGHRFTPVNLDNYTAHIVEGDNIQLLKDLCGIEGKILHTPGHTPGSISVILDSGDAFVGDAAMNFLNFCRIRYRPIYLSDIASVFASWEKIGISNAKIIYPAHGKPFLASTLEQFRLYWLEKYNLNK